VDDNQTPLLLSNIGNKVLIKHWNTLDVSQKQSLFAQLQKIDISTLRLQQQMLHDSEFKQRHISPFTHFSESGNEINKNIGLELISKGLVGCLIVAGGQGSRLYIDGPKGICKVTKVRKKSLFQLLAEKTLAASKQVQRKLPIAIMTSPLNHVDIIAFFEKNHFFGLDQKQLSFFQQETLPLLDEQGNLFLESKDHLSEGPDGNGGALQNFFKNGIWNNWYSQGIRYLNFILVDNALADPFDAELIGFHQQQNSDVIIKCIRRKDPEEKVGVIAQENGKTTIIEYTELSPEDRLALNSEGNLLHPLANLSLFSFKMEFVKLAAKASPILHKTFKAAKHLGKNGYVIKPEQPMAWKFEKFIFDILPLASKVHALIYPREICFAPLKNATGNDSYETVADAIEKSDRRVISTISGSQWNESPLEISQEFYYPTKELLNKWKKIKQTHTGYINS
jgi:UDP-N-acetylglucosamine/UDP-N-acetylgalactosamine diphosphorylase